MGTTPLKIMTSRKYDLMEFPLRILACKIYMGNKSQFFYSKKFISQLKIKYNSLLKRKIHNICLIGDFGL